MMMDGACPDIDIASIDQLLLVARLQNLTQGMAVGGGGLAGVLAPGNLPPPQQLALQCLLTAQGINPAALLAFLGSCQSVTQNVQIGALWDDVAIIAADLWDSEPRILSALLIGLDGDAEAALAGGATFVTDDQREELCGPGFDTPVTSVVPVSVGNLYNCKDPPNAHDGFPICFSWY